VSLDHRRGALEEAEHQVTERFGVETARQLRVRDEVAEENGDRLAALDCAIRDDVHVPNVHLQPYDFEVPAEPAVEVLDLVKRYPKSPVNAVDGVSFSVPRGEVFGLLGPNGAGKTTTVGMLTTRVRPTGGTARVGGVDVVGDPVGARQQVAVVPQRSNLDRSISIRDNLIFHAAYHGVPARERVERADELLDQFGLLDRSGDKPDFFSGGQSQRVMIARALMHAPRVLFLDEPTTGLDPAARLFVWDRLRELRDSDVTLVLTTHDMDEAALLADRVGIMDHGHLLALDTPDALISSLEGEGTLELTADQAADGAVVDALAALAGVERVETVQVAAESGAAEAPAPGSQPLRVRLYLTGDAALHVAPAAAVLGEHGLALQDVKLGTPTLEDVFIHLTGRTLR
jgi:ABC-2 type transport system ATP-binding protein